MITRSIASHIKRQDWTAITIEFFIVVLGVYAAFELDRWREAEADQRTNAAFVELLGIELEEELPSTRRRLEASGQDIEDQAAAIRWLNSEKPTTSFTSEMCRGIFQSGLPAWKSTRLETAGFFANGGQSQNTQDVELRRLLFALAARQEAGDSLFFRFVFQSVHIPDRYPHLMRRLDRGIPRVAEIRDDLSCDAEAMRADQGFKNQFFSNAGRQRALLSIREEELELLEAIAARVEQLRK